MKSSNTSGQQISSDIEQIVKLLPFTSGETLIELGCGPAETTRLLSVRFPGLKIIASDVDQVQFKKNLDYGSSADSAFSNLTFRLGGAQEIDMPNSSVEYVMMLKSLHHVPLESMAQSLHEICRVLVPGGLAYISEPIYAGDFNNILRLFNDERLSRQAAIDSIERVLMAGTFERVEQVFFDTVSRFNGFAEYEQRVLGATHTDFKIDAKLRTKIQAAFDPFLDADGVAKFHSPRRVDLLRTKKP